MTQDEMNVLVPAKLRELEQANNMTVLFACEAGSRAWGLDRPESDFDVRFVYMRDKSDYLSVYNSKDSITLPIDDVWDVCGWDLAKFLRFVHSSKSIPYECLGACVRYGDRFGFSEKLAPLLSEYFSRDRMLYNYAEQIGNNVIDRRKVLHAKHYFYMLLPVLAGLWVMEKNAPAPALFDELLVMLPESLRSQVEDLRNLRVNAPEDLEISRVREVDTFMYGSLALIKQAIPEGMNKKQPGKSWDPLNEFFREMLDHE